MRGLLVSGCIGVASMTLSGCGGSGNNTSEPSLYTGAYSGTFSAPETQGTGTITLVIADTGGFTGSLAGTGGLDGTISGTMLATGQFKVTKVGVGSTGYFSAMNGAMALTGVGLNGNFQYEADNKWYTGSFTATSTSSTTTASLRR